jgi:hypothetical protein
VIVLYTVPKTCSGFLVSTFQLFNLQVSGLVKRESKFHHPDENGQSMNIWVCLKMGISPSHYGFQDSNRPIFRKIWGTPDFRKPEKLYCTLLG